MLLAQLIKIGPRLLIFFLNYFIVNAPSLVTAAEIIEINGGVVRYSIPARKPIRLNTIVISAAGVLQNNVGPIMDVLVNGRKIGSVEVRNAVQKEYRFLAAFPTARELDIVFVNGPVNTNFGRTLILGSVMVNNISIPLSRGLYDLGDANSALDGVNMHSFVPPVMGQAGALKFNLGSGLSNLQMGLVINDNDPYSLAIGNAYAELHSIPKGNIVHIHMPVKSTINRFEFAPIKSFIDAALPAYVQGIALAWTYPYAVECNSITNAISMGFQKDPCESSTCTFGKFNPIFKSSTQQPFLDLKIRPSMLIAASSIQDGLNLINRGFNSNMSRPNGSAYIMKTTDSRRNIRASNFNHAFLGKTLSPLVNIQILNANFIQQSDILFYFQGLASISNIAGKNLYLPGLPMHLTQVKKYLVQN